MLLVCYPIHSLCPRVESSGYLLLGPKALMLTSPPSSVRDHTLGVSLAITEILINTPRAGLPFSSALSRRASPWAGGFEAVKASFTSIRIS